jgi:Major capsid protein Gp23
MEFKVSDKIMKKWAPILEHTDMPEITDNYRKQVTAMMLENQQQHLREAGPVNQMGGGGSLALQQTGGGIQTWDPILISLVRRAMPNLIAYDICGVQPMSGPTGLIFAMRSRYGAQTGDEALFGEASTAFGGSGSTGAGSAGTFGPTAGAYQDTYAVDPFVNGTPGLTAPTRGYSVGAGEALGDPAASNPFAQMAFSIEKTVVEARTRALKAEYSLELAQDLKAVHGLDAETELANILSAEILAEINREVVRTIYSVAKLGARAGTTQTTGVFDLNVDSNGRWSAEKFKGLLFQIEREANQIAKETRRGKGNFVVCSSDVASALAMAGVLDYAPALNTNLNVDDTGNTFVGVLNGKFRVHIDPYASLQRDFFCVGYKGSSPFDAGLFYCPYVPLQMVRAVGQDNFQPKIAFKTRYGLVSNPFVFNASGVADGQALSARVNQYYRIVRVDNLF